MAELKEGRLSLDTAKSWDFDRQQATSVYLDAQIAASQAEKKSLDKISAAKNKLAGDRAYLVAMQAALIIQSPEEGNFSARVAVSGFLKKGDTIGEIVTCSPTSDHRDGSQGGQGDGDDGSRHRH